MSGLLFADDTTLMADSENNLQRYVSASGLALKNPVKKTHLKAGFFNFGFICAYKSTQKPIRRKRKLLGALKSQIKYYFYFKQMLKNLNVDCAKYFSCSV